MEKFFQQGLFFFNKEGKVIEFTPVNSISIKTPVGTISIKENNPVKLFASGCIQSVFLSQNNKLEYKDQSYNTYSRISFYDNWIPQFLCISKTSIKLKYGTLICDEMVSFHPTGEINELHLMEPAKITTPYGNISVKDNLLLSKEGNILEATVINSTSFTTKYGQIYSTPNTKITFHDNENLKSVISYDIAEISVCGVKLTTMADTEICFSKNGLINKATVLNEKIKFFGWKINSDTAWYNLFVYPKNRIVIINLPNATINNQKIENCILLDKENCYTFDLGTKEKILKHYDKNGNCIESIAIDGTPTILTKNSEIDLSHSPIIFDENNKVIGFRKAVDDAYFDVIKDEWMHYNTEYNYYTSYGYYNHYWYEIPKKLFTFEKDVRISK